MDRASFLVVTSKTKGDSRRRLEVTYAFRYRHDVVNPRPLTSQRWSEVRAVLRGRRPPHVGQWLFSSKQVKL
jgi:hypothetical protein